MLQTDDASSGFEPHRRYLTGLAYRMLGSLAEAEDIVQDAYLRWHGTERTGIDNARAFLARTVTRLCLDHLKSARVRRETYVGPWLPEPVLDEASLAAESASDYAHDLSVALLLVLERLSPLERAAFLLHDVFDMDFAQVSAALGRNEAACRQLASRARTHVHAERPRFQASADEGARLADAFLTASTSGDAAALTSLLADSVVAYTDGGGKRSSARNVLTGVRRVAGFFLGLTRKHAARGIPPADFRPARINGQPGFVMTTADGGVQTMSFDVIDGRIQAVYIVRNPDKLRHIVL